MASTDELQSGANEKVGFTNPPVKAVALTVYFEPIVGLQVTHLSAFRQGLREAFPNSAEMPPLQPVNRGNDETKLLPVNRSWPFPYVLYSAPNEESGVAVQNDRFVRSWAFSDEAGSGYPGFEHLYTTMQEQFDRFAEVIRSEVQQEVILTGSEAFYANTLPDMTDSDLLVGIATRWSGEPEQRTLKTRYSGIRLHLCDDDDLEGCSINLAVDRDDDGVQLNIEVGYSLPEDGGDDGFELGGLRHAHDHVITTFMNYTSAEMKEEWGMQS